MRPVFLFSVISLLLAIPLRLGGGVPVHPGVRLIREYQKISPAEPTTVNPYFVNLMAIELMEKGKIPLKDVRTWILWYLDQLNYPDRYGLTGTIYDYEVEPDGEERRLNLFDSVDSYSATFLWVLSEYVARSGDKALAEENKDKIQDVAYTIVFLQDNDGLTFAMPDKKAKYLMDNCEVFAGLTQFVLMSVRLGWDTTGQYDGARLALADGILGQLYDAESRNFFWARDLRSALPSDWKVFYPDAYAQIFPILAELPRLDPELKAHLWSQFEKVHGAALKKAPLEQQIVIRLAKQRMSRP